MRAVCWYGKHDMRVEQVPDPKILNPHDAIVRVTLTAICGSDLHLYNNLIPTLEEGDIVGHEFMGEVVEVGSEVKNLSVGDRVVVPFTISCGHCFFCQKQLWSLCDNTNPNTELAESFFNYATAGLFGYTHLMGGYAGGQAEYVRVPFADVGPIKIQDGLTDEQVLFLSDIFPTGYMAAENCHIEPGDTVAIWGCGPVGQFAIRSAFLLGAERVIAIDRVPGRLAMARRSGAETLDYSEVDPVDALPEMTGGRGPDACIDAVGMEAHGTKPDAIYDFVKQKIGLTSDRPHVFRQALQACRKGGTVSLAGVYGSYLDNLPFGAAFNKGLRLEMGQTHVQRYLHPLLDRIRQGQIDPSFVITDRITLDEAPQAYERFNGRTGDCIKVVMTP